MGSAKDGMNMPYGIRTAGTDDEGRIRELFVEMLQTICRTDTVSGYEPGYLDKFWSGGEDRIYVAEDAEVVAFLSVEVYRAPQSYIYLDDLSVTEAYRNRGIGTALIRTAEARAKALAIPAIVFHVAKSNGAARRLYERLGYEVFRDDGSRYLMKKDLP